MKTIITTSNQESQENLAKAQKLAQILQLPCVPRSSIKHDPEQILVVVGSDKIFLRYQNKNLSWHHNMAKLRLLNLQRNGQDPLLQAVQPLPGDKVLDCTLGLGADSLVLAYAVGPTGKVTALESEALVALLTSKGFSALNDDLLHPLTKRIEIINIAYSKYLHGLYDNSFDIIYLDPMFEKTKAKSTGIEILRLVGNPSPLAKEDVNLALKKCRRRLVIKENLYSDFFKRIIPDQLIKTSSDIGYGIYFKDKQEG